MSEGLPGIERLELDGPVAIVGDIHGRLDLLTKLLAELDRLPVLVAGDVVDRGSDPRSVVDLLVQRDAGGVLGNHDQWLVSWALGQGFDGFALHSVFGGESTLASYGVEGREIGDVEEQFWRVPNRHRIWLEQLPLVLDLQVGGEEYWLIHAGVPRHPALAHLEPEKVVPWYAQNAPDALMWVHTPPEMVAPVDRTVIMGHYPLVDPVDTGEVIALDTGAGVFGDDGRLSAVVLPGRELITVGR